MPNIKSAVKSLRQDKKKHARNKAALSELRTLVKQVRVLIESKDKKKSDEVLKKLESKLKKAAKSDIIRKNNASRRISRLRSRWAKI